MTPGCPLCDPEAPQGTPGAILGAFARAEHERADLLDGENQALTLENDRLRAELKTAMDALHAFIAPKSLARADLNTIDARKELPPP